MELRTPLDVAALVRGARADREMSQDDLAGRAGVSRKTINEIERGRSDPRISNVLLVIDALGLRLTARSPHRPESAAQRDRIDLDEHLRQQADDD